MSGAADNLTVLQGDCLANPILEKLCQSFYEEEKWQRLLLLQADGDGDSDWVSSVTVVMVAFAATAVSTSTYIGDPVHSEPTYSTTMPSRSGDLEISFRGHSRVKGLQEPTAISTPTS